MVFVSTSILFIPLIYGISMNLIMLVVNLEIVLCTSLVFVFWCKETIGFDKYLDTEYRSMQRLNTTKE